MCKGPLPELEHLRAWQLFRLCSNRLIHRNAFHSISRSSQLVNLFVQSLEEQLQVSFERAAKLRCVQHQIGNRRVQGPCHQRLLPQHLRKN